MEVDSPQDSPKQHKTLYDLLNVAKDAKPSEIKKSYHRLALKVHPDKNKDDPEAKENFQKLQKAYALLMNEEKRKIYDESGFTGEEDEAFQEAYIYYRELYKKINEDDINNFVKVYKTSDMEKEDVLQFYVDFEGDMTHILEHVPLSEMDDLPRFFKIIEQAINNEEIDNLANFEKTKDAVRELKDDDGDFEDLPEEKEKTGTKVNKPKKRKKVIKKKKNQEDIGDLASMILAKKEQRNSGGFLADLEAKYCSGSGATGKSKKKAGTRKKKDPMDISEEDFQKARNRLMKNQLLGILG